MTSSIVKERKNENVSKTFIENAYEISFHTNSLIEFVFFFIEIFVLNRKNKIIQ